MKVNLNVNGKKIAAWKVWAALITMPIWAPICILAFWIVHIFEWITEGVPDEYTNDER